MFTTNVNVIYERLIFIYFIGLHFLASGITEGVFGLHFLASGITEGVHEISIFVNRVYIFFINFIKLNFKNYLLP